MGMVPLISASGACLNTVGDVVLWAMRLRYLVQRGADMTGNLFTNVFPFQMVYETGFLPASGPSKVGPLDCGRC